MNEKEQLTQYITKQLQAGSTTTTIKQQLLEHGWDESLIDEVLREQTNQNQPGVTTTPGAQPELAKQFDQTEPSAQVPHEAEVPKSLSIRGAFSEALSAIKANTLALVAMAIIGSLTTALALGLVVAAGLVSFFSSNIMNDFKTGDVDMYEITFNLLPLVLLAIVLFSISSAFVQSITGLAINDGAEGRKSDIKQTLATGVKRTLRVMLATALYTLIVAGPLLVVAVIALLIGVLAKGLWPIIFLFALVAIVMTIILAFRFILIPTVALFELEVPLSKLRGRSQQLMSGGGMTFLVKYALIIFVINIFITALFPAGTKAEDGFNFSSLIGSALQALVYLFYSAVFIIFYRNRKALKG